MNRSEMSLFDYAVWLKRRGMWIIGGGLGAAVIMALVTRSIVVIYSSTAIINTGTLGDNIVNGGDIDSLGVGLNGGGFRRALVSNPEINAKVTHAWLQFSGLTKRVVVRVDATDPESAKQAADLVAAYAIGLYSEIRYVKDRPGVETPLEPVSVVEARAKLVTEGERIRAARSAAAAELAAAETKPGAASRIAELAARKTQLNIALALTERAIKTPDSQALIDAMRMTSTTDRVLGIELTPTISIVAATILAKRPPEKRPNFEKVTLEVPADLPTTPSWPKIQINLLIAFIFGAVAGSFAILLREP